eukprot:TRINITY_DN19691_c0_g1_i1.p1 TRINITY_DN19691_c0_g1~~TRINITY_DN19691_c0_g1_i1.p1  ORF type:complete len:324 (-),score=51.66 TRINITY_DN19691_c0_g1_i1:40-1011(-)
MSSDYSRSASLAASGVTNVYTSGDSGPVPVYAAPQALRHPHRADGASSSTEPAPPPLGVPVPGQRISILSLLQGARASQPDETVAAQPAVAAPPHPNGYPVNLASLMASHSQAQPGADSSAPSLRRTASAKGAPANGSLPASVKSEPVTLEPAKPPSVKRVLSYADAAASRPLSGSGERQIPSAPSPLPQVPQALRASSEARSNGPFTSPPRGMSPVSRSPAAPAPSISKQVAFQGAPSSSSSPGPASSSSSSLPAKTTRAAVKSPAGSKPVYIQKTPKVASIEHAFDALLNFKFNREPIMKCFASLLQAHPQPDAPSEEAHA